MYGGVDGDRRGRSAVLSGISPRRVFIGGLCCFTPVVFVLSGVGSVSYAAGLTDVLYYEYRWAFQLAGLGFFTAAFEAHSYSTKGVCSLETAVRKCQ